MICSFRQKVKQQIARDKAERSEKVRIARFLFVVCLVFCSRHSIHRFRIEFSSLPNVSLGTLVMLFVWRIYHWSCCLYGEFITGHAVSMENLSLIMLFVWIIYH